MRKQSTIEEIDLKKFLRAIYRRKLAIVIVFLVILVPLVILNENIQPTYSSSTTIIIEQVEAVTPLSLFKLPHPMLKEAFVSNIIEEIKSLSVAMEVIEELPDKILASLQSSNGDEKSKAKLGTLIQKSLDVEPIGKSDILEISAEASDPVVASQIANTTAGVYINRQIKIRRNSVSGIRDFLEDQLQVYKERLQNAETDLASFKESNEITVLDKQAEELLSRYTSAEVVHNNNKTDREAKERRLSYLKEKIAEQRVDLVPSLVNIDSPRTQKLKERLVEIELDFMELQLQNYSADHPRMMELQTQIDQTKQNLMSEAMELAKGDSFIDSYSQLRKYLEESLTLQIEIESIKAKEKVISKTLGAYNQSLKSIPAKELQLARLIRGKSVNEQTFMMLMQKREEARLTEAEQTTNLRIIDVAEVPEKPVSPKKILNILVGLILASMTSLGIVLLGETLKEVVETAEDIKESTNLNVLATIPKFSLKQNNIGINDNGKPAIFSLNKEILKSNPKKARRQMMINELMDGTPDAESYHILRSQVQLALKDEKVGSILVTSAGPQEGKSTTAMNLAVSLANQGVKTLLIDMDLRRPVVHEVFETSLEPGLADFLFSFEKDRKSDKNEDSSSNDLLVDVDLDVILEVVHTTSIPNLFVLSAGSGKNNRAQLISSFQLKKVLNTLKNFFNSIIIDGPPLLIVSETATVSSLSDGVILVVECERTNLKALKDSKNLLENVNSKIIGTVLNNVNFNKIYKKNKYYYYY